MPCVTIPGQPYIPGVPSYVVNLVVLGWNGGANSIAQHGEDCYFKFSVDQALIGVVAGLGPPDRTPNNFARLTHAFQLVSANGVLVWQIVEGGAAVGSQVVQFNAGDEFFIRRVRGIVQYFINSMDQAGLKYTSQIRSTGQIRAGAVLYASGDKVI
ncbi:MAG: hypothetical protein E6Q97_30860 [Desulfurellales bacterium]|nr:MAG: hypothetical protein E6Q97_30860 [Desulfurellales bacterium]